MTFDINSLHICEFTDYDRVEVFAIIKQLRELTYDEFLKRVNQQRIAGYTLIGAFFGEKLVGVIGIRPLSTLARGLHLHIDDLVVDADWKKRGVGKALLCFAEDWAMYRSIRSVFLDSRHEVEGFYKKLGYSPHTAILLRKRLN